MGRRCTEVRSEVLHARFADAPDKAETSVRWSGGLTACRVSEPARPNPHGGRSGPETGRLRRRRRRVAGQTLHPAQPDQNRTCRFPRHRAQHRPGHLRSTAGTVQDGTSGGREHGWRLRGGVAAHHDIGVAACSRSGSKTILRAAHELPALQQLETATAGPGFSRQHPLQSA